jgi:serine phosphatase RsbU (regulator of sigma subunit)/anti-sigma regulatory factor (Ser/Thr protein kinase)
LLEQEPAAALDQMQQLVRVIVEIGSDLDLNLTLHRIIDGAMELTGAPYGSLGIRGSDGSLVSIVQAGIDEVTARTLGELPVGEGLRVDDLSADPHGLQLQNSPLRALLGIPIIVRAADFGALYLADDRTGHVFSDSDESAVRALATAAAAAIDNARLFERERESARWTKASREITTALLSGDPQTGPLQLIVNRALELAGAEQAILLVPKEPDVPANHVDALVVAATAGRYASQVIGQQVPMDGSTTGGVARRGLPLITDSFEYPIEGFTDVGARSAIVMPLIADESVLGVIAVARDPQQPPFGNDYLDLVSDFARHAAIALALAAGREHALNQELAQADTVDDALRAAAEELRRLWRAHRVLTVTFPTRNSSTGADGTPEVVSVGEPAQWSDLPSDTRQVLNALREGDLLTPNTTRPGTAGIALQHPEGVLVVWIELTEQRPFTLEDQTLLTVLAGRLGQGLQRVHQVDQQRETALALQHAILGPSQLPRGFSVRYQAASRPLQVGGDWYDIVDLDDGRIAFVVGDCVGHGLAAATVMGQVRSACRALLFGNPSPAAALSGLDRFAARLPGAQSTTAVCVVLDPETGELVYSSAGHPPPVLVHADGATRMLDDGHTIALGVRSDWVRPEGRVTMPARATLLLYTDGLVERRRSPLELGLERLTTAVQDGRVSALEELADQIMSGLAPSDGYQDDVVLLLYRQPEPLELNFPANASQLAPTRSALRRWLTRAKVDAELSMDVLVAAGEAVANAIEHGHRHSPEGIINLSATALVDQVQVTITDTGTWKPAQPSDQSNRGRGITLMRALMQAVTIDSDTAGTTVRLSARIT